MFRQQKLVQLTAHEKILIFDNFRYLLEALEEYIEKSGYYPNFLRKRQFKYLTIPKEQSRNLTIDSAEDIFRTRLLIFVGMDTPDFLRGQIKEEFYKWIKLVEIDFNDCPDKKLKHFLLEIENVIEGKTEKILGQTEKYLDEKRRNNPINPNEMLEIFGSIQEPLNKNRARAETLKSKTHVEVENENKLKGDWKGGREIFKQLTSEVSNHHNSFNFYQNESQSERDYNLALWKWDNWTDKDFLNNGETREGLRQWIIELERQQQQAQIEQPPAYDWDLR